MNTATRLRWVFVLAATLGAFQLRCGAQDAPTCGTASFPFEALTKPGDCDAGAADFAKAVSHDRMIELSNCGGKIYCKEGSARTSSIVPLSGTDLDTCIFQLSSDIGGDLHTLFDSRVIWDPYLDRFWMVTAERGEVVLGNGNRKWRGKLHIAVSADGAPDSLSTYHWTKYTTGGTRGALDVNSLPNSLPSLADAFPDRPSIFVDDTFLFIAMKEADAGHQFNIPPEPNRFFDARSLICSS